MNNSKRNSEISTKTFCIFAAVATFLFALGMNALMNKIDARRTAQEHVLADYCSDRSDAKRPSVCIQWDASRSEGRTATPQG